MQALLTLAFSALLSCYKYDLVLVCSLSVVLHSGCMVELPGNLDLFGAVKLYCVIWLWCKNVIIYFQTQRMCNAKREPDVN
jgi:hypothetical protein